MFRMAPSWRARCPGMVQPTRTGGRPSIDPMHEFGPRNQMIASMGMKAAARGLIERQRDRRSRSPGR